jgi:predicted transcriptional regulator
MSKSALELLLDSRARVKILKFIFRNADSVFSAKEMSTRIQERLPLVKREIKKLAKIGLLKQKTNRHS